MPETKTETTTDKIRRYFPEYRPQSPEDAELSKGPEYLLEARDITSYLQTLFFEERVVSVQIGETTRNYNTLLWDNVPEPVEEEVDGETVLVDPEYVPGSYLKEHTHINILPLEPVSGNMLVRSGSPIILFFYAGTTSVELGVSFLQVTTVRTQQVIQCTFPEVARIIRNNRQYRAKALKDKDIYVSVAATHEDNKPVEYLLFDLSTHGLAFGGPDPLDHFEVDAELNLIIDSQSPDPIELSASIRNFNKVRTRHGAMHICGVLFDLETRTLASRIEKKYAALQRAFIRSLNEETEGMDIDLKIQ